MPSFEEYQSFAEKMKALANAQRVHRCFFWLGATTFWVLICVISAYVTRYLLTTLSFFPENISISVVDILKVYGVFIFLWVVRKLFPLE